jgi:hypothetical protein
MVATIPTQVSAQASIRIEYPLDQWVAPSSWYNVVLDCTGGDAIFGEFEVTEGISIDFLIMDDAKFGLWSRGLSVDADEYKENVTSYYAWDYEVTTTGRYHIIFHNFHATGQAHVEGAIIHLGAPFVGQLLLSSLVILVVVLILGAGVFVHRRLLKNHLGAS